MSDQLPQKVIDQIRLTVRTAVKSAVKEVVDQLLNQNRYPDSIKDEDFLSAKQAALFLKIKLGTLYSKVEKCELPYYKVGKRKLLFSKDELFNSVIKIKEKGKSVIDHDINAIADEIKL